MSKMQSRHPLLRGLPARPIVDFVLMGMGYEGELDYAQDKTTFSNRLSRCYELAGMAMQANGDPLLKEAGIPDPEFLVHGTWHGPEAPRRIGHAWVLLSDQRVWEPITGAVCDRVQFYAYTRATDGHVLKAEDAIINILRSGHYGPWV